MNSENCRFLKYLVFETVGSLYKPLVFRVRLMKRKFEQIEVSKKRMQVAAKAGAENWPIEKIKQEIANCALLESIARQRVEQIISEHWIAKATKAYLPLPSQSDDDMWTRTEELGFVLVRSLSAKGVTSVRSMIRDEASKRFAVWEKVVAALWTVLTVALGYWIGKK